MKKKLIKTLLIGATIGTTLTGFARSSVDACYLSHDTIAFTNCRDRVQLCIVKGEYYKKYSSANYDYIFYDYDNNWDGHADLYCYNLDGTPKTGFVRNNGDCYYFYNGKATTGNRWIDGRLYNFNTDNFKGSIVK